MQRQNKSLYLLSIHLFILLKREKERWRGSISKLKDFRPSDKFDNPYLRTPWVTNDNNGQLCRLLSGTCFRVHGTLLNLHEHCLYITNYCFSC